jgi:hypothetical protein
MAATGLTAVTGLEEERWQRIQNAIRKPGALDSHVVSELEAETATLHQLERRVPARQLFVRLELHLDRLSELLDRSPRSTLRRRLIRTTGDSATLGAWLAWDMRDARSTAKLYETATLAAREADDHALRACILAYASYDAPPRTSRQLLQQAVSYADGGRHPATFAWVACRQAEEAAELGEDQEAMRLLDRGLTAYEIANPDEERAWTRFLDPSRMAGFSISTYSRLGLTDKALDAGMSVLGSLGPGAPGQKKRALVLANIAEVHLQRQDLEAGLELGAKALNASRDTESTLGFAHLRRLRPHLATCLHVPEARQLDEQLQTLFG